MEYKAKSRGWAWNVHPKPNLRGSGVETGRGVWQVQQDLSLALNMWMVSTKVLWAYSDADTPTLHPDPNQKQGDLWWDTSRATQSWCLVGPSADSL